MSEIISFDALAGAVGERPGNHAGAGSRIVQIIAALVQKKFPQWVRAADLASVLGVADPENATTAELMARVRELSAAARSKQPVKLTALAASYPSDGATGLPRAGLALALDLSETAAADAILAKLRELAEEIYGDLDQDEEIQRRRDLVGLSATAPWRTTTTGKDQEHEMRRMLARTICATTAEHVTGIVRTGTAFNVEDALSQLSAAQLVALSVATIAHGKRVQDVVSQIKAWAPNVSLARLSAAPAKGPQLHGLARAAAGMND
jgi:hypothetical protein